MWRYLAGGAAALAMVGAGALVLGSHTRPEPLLPATPAAAVATPMQTGGAEALPALPEATPKTREEKRFGRYDKDRDGRITRDEYLAARRKAYAKLDTNKDGRLSFDEWAAKTTAKFATADRDTSGTMTPVEFATTAPKRTARARCVCPPAAAAVDD
ncbi:histidine kinase [Sphingomonas sp. Leaf17]|uniref:EF-hand domain-containing protein n=1 Tax=Sphingomonas sp. Leaf17 TaxID=1735683 RepID=UPI0006F4EE5F|nr:EF-hand domain-containing protein [Sphingomonas sp. Leaf17]KQM65168.1 histidine kinase [Sphingomonas sp. Leaf17]